MEATVDKAAISQPEGTPTSAESQPASAAGGGAVFFCAACAREIGGGPVIVRGTRYCSLECGMTAAIPGRYFG